MESTELLGERDYTDFLASKRLVAPATGIEIDRADLHPAMFPFQADVTTWALRKGRAAMFLDCVAGSSRILTSQGYQPIQERNRQWTEIYSLSPTGPVVTPAFIFKKGNAGLLRIRTQGGRTIEIASRHLFLTSSGWLLASEIEVGVSLAVSDADRLLSILESGQLVQHEDDRHWSDTIQDCQARYTVSPSQCSYGEPPLRGASIAQLPFLSQVGVQELAPLLRQMDVRDNKLKRTHPRLSIGRLSMRDYVTPASYAESDAGYCSFSSFAKWYSLNSQELFRPASSDSPEQSIPEFSQSHQVEDYISEVVQFSCLEVYHDPIVSVEKVDAADYYDMYVPGYHNYLAEGMWHHNTGLGKSFCQIEWARILNNQGYCVLIVAPLAVAKQTVREAAKWGTAIEYVREPAAISGTTETIITNYEHVQKFDMRQFGGVVLDESSILKSQDGKTRTRLIEMCREIPFRLCCTATPAPNDISEIANHAEFLGLMSRTEMLAHFFVHGDTGWRLKGHASEPFYRWLASWGMSVKKPSDLGYEDGAFILPPLTITPHFVQTDWKPDGMLFSVKLRGIGERSQARKATLLPRVAKTVEIVEAEPNQRWLIFCDTNDESTALKKALDAVEVKGSDTLDHKERSLLGFANGDIPRLVSKTSIAGFGLNLQVCSRVLYCGLSDSEEKFYQGTRRVWRFGQPDPVTAHIVLSDAEYPIYENVMRKEAKAAEMSANLIQNVAAYERTEISSHLGSFNYADDQEIKLPSWLNGGV